MTSEDILAEYIENLYRKGLINIVQCDVAKAIVMAGNTFNECEIDEYDA